MHSRIEEQTMQAPENFDSIKPYTNTFHNSTKIPSLISNPSYHS